MNRECHNKSFDIISDKCIFKKIIPVTCCLKKLCFTVLNIVNKFKDAVFINSLLTFIVFVIL